MPINWLLVLIQIACVIAAWTGGFKAYALIPVAIPYALMVLGNVLVDPYDDYSAFRYVRGVVVIEYIGIVVLIVMVIWAYAPR